MILWREKFRAFAIHFVATLVVAMIAAALIFFVWYPDPFQKMVGGMKLFLLVSGCDLALGPLLSLIVYSSRKTRKALYFDYIVIGIVQLAAFVYGVYSVSQNRPAYVVFVKDRIEVIAAGEIAAQDYAEGTEAKFQSPPMWGPEYAATLVNQNDKSDAMWTALDGRDVSVRPRFYVEYDTQLSEIKNHAQPISTLIERHPKSKSLIDEAVGHAKRPVEELGWLPVKHTRGFWTALIDDKTGHPVEYFDLDPY